MSFEQLKPDSLLRQQLIRISTGCAILVFITGLLVLAGWQWNVDLLKQPVPHITGMNPLSAVDFILATGAFLFLAPSFGLKFPTSFPQRTKLATGRVLAVVLLLTGLLRIASTFHAVGFSVDQALYPSELISDSNKFSAHMTINTACCFILTGISLLLINKETKTGSMPAQYLAVLIGILALFSIVGYLYRVQAFYGLFKYTPMAIHTATCFLLISFALLFANPGKGIMQQITSSYTGGLMARRLLPLCILLPILLGYLRMWGHWQGLFTTEFGVTLLVSSIVLIFVFVIAYNTRLLNKRDVLRKEADLTVLESEERYRLLVSNVKDYAIFMLDPSGYVLSWNEGAERIKGYKAEEIIGRHMSVFYTEEELGRGEPAQNLARAREKGRFELEGWRLRKGGIPFWGNIVFTALYDHNGSLLGFTKVTRDITERKKLEQQLLQFNKDLESQVTKKTAELTGIFERITDAFIAMDKNLCYTYLNKKAGELIHRDPASLIGKWVWDVFPDAIGSATYLAFNKAMAEQKNITNTDYYAPLNLWQENHLYPSPDGLSVFIRDITEQKKTEEELQQSYENIRQLASHLQDIREDERAAMAREIHDELGQQLTGIKMDLSWITKRIPNQEDNDELRQKARTTLDLLDTTIKTVRRIATELRPSILDDLGLIAAIEWQSQEFQKRSGISTEFFSNLIEFTGTPAIAIGLFRICQESLTNIARHAEPAKVTITLQGKENESIRLKIEDDGEGFQPDMIGNKKTLGLLGMKERTLMMGGDFNLSSQSGKGTVLSVTVPFNIQ